MGELYQKTMKRETVVKDLGYKLVTIWEADFDGEFGKSKGSKKRLKLMTANQQTMHWSV